MTTQTHSNVFDPTKSPDRKVAAYCKAILSIVDDEKLVGWADIGSRLRNDFGLDDGRLSRSLRELRRAGYLVGSTVQGYARPSGKVGTQMLPRPAESNDALLYPKLAGLVEALRADPRMAVLTFSGLARREASIDMAVESGAALRSLAKRFNVVEREIGDAASFRISLNYSDDSDTSCDFDVMPNWIMLNIEITANTRSGAPSRVLMAKIAKAYADACVEAVRDAKTLN